MLALPRQVSKSPTFRLPNKSKSWKVEKLASWHTPPPTSRGAPARIVHTSSHPAPPTAPPAAPTLRARSSYPRVDHRPRSPLLPRGKRKNHPPALIALCNECTMQALHSATRTRGTHTTTPPSPGISTRGTPHHQPAPVATQAVSTGGGIRILFRSRGIFTEIRILFRSRGILKLFMFCWPRT